MEPFDKPPGAVLVDANGDGALTITDVGAWLADLFFLPGDWAIWAAATYVAPIAGFFELDAGAYGGVLSGFVSAIAWLTGLLAAALILQGVRSADEALTAAVVRVWAELQRQYRVAMRRIKLRGHAAAAAQARSLDYVEELTVSAEELRVLRLHAALDDGDRLAAAEIAARLKLRRDAVAQVCNGLVQQKLLAATRGPEGETCYALTQAGSALLVFGQLAAKKNPAAAGLPRTGAVT